MPPVSIKFPLGGLNRRLDYQSQPAFTSPDLLNVLDRDCFASRMRGGSRPGLVKALSTQIGSGNPIRGGCMCRSLNSVGTSIFTDPFDSAMGAPNWAAGTFTVNGVASTGTLPTVAGGAAKIDATIQQEARVAVLIGVTNISTTTFRKIMVTTDAVASTPDLSEALNLYLDLDNASLSEASGVVARISKDGSGNGTLTLKVHGTTRLTQSFAPGADSPNAFSLSIDGSGIMVVTWRGVDYQWVESGYTPPAAPRAGFALSKSSSASTGDVAITSCTVNYTSTTGGDPPNMLVAASNGILYKQTTLGTWVAVGNSSGLTLASDRLLSMAAYEGKVYVADYGIRKKRLTASSAATVVRVGAAGDNHSILDDSDVTDWTTLGIDPLSDRLEILSATGGTPVPAGIYPIESVHATNGITFTATNGPSATSVAYRICRAPKVYDSATDQIALVQIGTIGSGDHQFPLNCSLVAPGMGRLWWSGDSDYPHYAYVSKSGDPDNYAYALDTEGSAFAWDPARLAGSTSIGDAITALIPHRDDYFIFGCRNSAFVQRGDPTIGGRLDIITSVVGIIGTRAYCRLPDGSLTLGTTAGIYRISPSPEAVPLPVSPLSIPQELRAISTAFDASAPTVGTDVLMEFDVERGLVDIFLSPRAGGSSTVHFFHRPGDLGDVEGILQYGGSFWPATIPNTMDPTMLVAYTPSGGTQTICMLCRDGYARRWSDAATDDDGTAFTSYARIGPIMLSGGDYLDGLLEEVVVQTAKDSNTVTVGIQVGISGEAAFNATIETLGTVAGNLKRTFPVRRRGNAVILRLSRTTAGGWSTENQQVFRTPLGKQRVG